MDSILPLVLLSLVGTSLTAGVPYVIRGDQVPDIEYWPWQGSLHQRFGGFVCGVSLISKEWAVTAASCVQSPPYDVKFGSIRRSEGTLRPVKEIITHESYSTSGYYKYNDIAVLRFSALELSNSIESIKLGATDESYNDNCYFTGWGLTDNSDVAYPEYLHQAHQRIPTNRNCDGNWPDIDGSHVCTWYTDTSNPKGTCRGDTGGPLVCYKKDHYELVGISSWQRSDCNPYDCSVYTRVSQFRTWILEKTLVTYDL